MSIQRVIAHSSLEITPDELIQARREYNRAPENSAESAKARLRWHNLFMAAIGVAKKSGIDALKELSELTDPRSGEPVRPPGAVQDYLEKALKAAEEEGVKALVSCQPAWVN
jgi:hypothetical protein